MSQSYTNIIDDLRLLEQPGIIPWWGWILLVLGVATLALYLVWRQRHAKALAVAQVQAAIVAGEDALAELENVHKKLSKANCRPYAIEVSGIVRRYLEHRFDIRAPQRSTEEFLVEARRSPLLTEKYQGKLGHFLGCCDFLKFAKGTAEEDELELLHQAAVIFVTETRLPAETARQLAAQDKTSPVAKPEVIP
jgi:hypothetical protein